MFFDDICYVFIILNTFLERHKMKQLLLHRAPTLFNIKQLEEAEKYEQTNIKYFGNYEINIHEEDNNAENIIKKYLENSYLENLIFHVAEKFSYNCFYIQETNTLIMPYRCCFVSSDLYYMVFFHEIAHSTSHKNITNREKLLSVKLLTEKDEEKIAKMVAIFMCIYVFKKYKYLWHMFLLLNKEKPSIQVMKESIKAFKYILKCCK